MAWWGRPARNLAVFGGHCLILEHSVQVVKGEIEGDTAKKRGILQNETKTSEGDLFAAKEEKRSKEE